MNAASDKTPVLVVDDEPPIRRLLRTSLTAEGFEVLEAETGEKAMALIGSAKPEIVILDLGLPDFDGVDVIRRIRTAGLKIPIIVLSSRSGERQKVEALELGADDYVTKPFGIAELVARMRTALRHRFQEQGGEPLFKSGSLSVDLVRRIVLVNDVEIKLSPKEYEILRLLVLHAGKVLTHRFLMQEVWGAACDVQYLRIYVRQLRQKIETEPEAPAHILTETGVGYRLRVQEGPAEGRT
jgi:two-component system, OmpR family, KDP operon response regulator KdpE